MEVLILIKNIRLDLHLYLVESKTLELWACRIDNDTDGDQDIRNSFFPSRTKRIAQNNKVPILNLTPQVPSESSLGKFNIVASD